MVPKTRREQSSLADRASNVPETVMTTPLIIPRAMPGSRGEHELQEQFGTRARADAFPAGLLGEARIRRTRLSRGEWPARREPTGGHELRARHHGFGRRETML